MGEGAEESKAMRPFLRVGAEQQECGVVLAGEELKGRRVLEGVDVAVLLAEGDDVRRQEGAQVGEEELRGEGAVVGAEEEACLFGDVRVGFLSFCFLWL